MKNFSEKNISLNEKEELRAQIMNRRGRSFVDLRIWAAPKSNESKWPTGKGVLIPVSRWPELKQLVSDLGLEIEGPVVHE
jgi:hypothetical protein